MARFSPCFIFGQARLAMRGASSQPMSSAYLFYGENGWLDLPASYHGGSGSFSFIDGHSAMHKWLEGTTCVRVTMVSHTGFPTTMLASSDMDFQWTLQHGTTPYPNAW